MAVKIRLQRGGATHAPHYRIVVAESKSPRDGRFVEIIGTYDPKNKDKDRQLNLKLDRAEHWLSVGAQPSDTVRSLIRKVRKTAGSSKDVSPVAEPATEEVEA